MNIDFNSKLKDQTNIYNYDFDDKMNVFKIKKPFGSNNSEAVCNSSGSLFSNFHFSFLAPNPPLFSKHQVTIFCTASVHG